MGQIRFNPYKVGLVDFAKSHRKQPTKAESLFWWIVRNKKMLWYKFKRENAVWSFILDFYCSELLLWVEIDGWYHDEVQDYDEDRESRLYDKFWIKVIRFTNEEVEKNLDWVAQCMEDIIKDREKELWL
jgi:very-short-patch-repair endonuclease